MAVPTMRRVLQYVLLLCAVSAALASPRQQGDQHATAQGVKTSDDVSFAALRTLVQQQASTIDRLTADLTAVRNQVDSMSHTVDSATKTVAFTARIARTHNGISGMTLGDHQTVVFDNVVTNIGSGYNHTDGLFIAPVNGSYVFSLHQMNADVHNALVLAIVKNGAVLDLALAEGSGAAYDQGSSMVTTQLTAGDHVWVRQDSGDGVRGSYWTIFSGFLLHAE
eukprot:TRINITY_DN1029_c0_g1_i14.p1 TRINITY_DN1029_c0_g1~~TRINITY_DN1029_c0_g1_i14.p1  ORF type:complete len:223 (-),score=44.31 TRINITY_DN1029_c0_g1_i14:188-856(-)